MNKGLVYIIGAGPGIPDLITIRGLRAIKSSEVLIVDSLLPYNFLEDTIFFIPKFLKSPIKIYK